MVTRDFEKIKRKVRRRRIRKIIIIAIIAVLALFAVFAVTQMIQFSKMSPLPTGKAAPNVFAVRDSMVNVYFVRGEEGYLAIDAGTGGKAVADGLEKLGIPPDKVRAVLLTHTDMDHKGALALFPDADIYISAQEVQMIDGTTTRNFGSRNSLDFAYKTLGDGETVRIAGFTVKGILTPGHTPGSMCYLINDKYLFTGDTMSFKYGRADLFNSFFNMDDEIQRESIHKLAGMPTPEMIFTAHYGYSDDPADAFTGWGR